MTKFRRKKISRYTTIDTGIPPLETTPKTVYPSFSPEMGSFNKDRFHRSGNTFSDKDFQLLTKFAEPDHYGSEAYKKAIFRGVDLFKEKSYLVSKWVNSKSAENGPYFRHMKSSFKDYKDPFSVRRLPPQDWDQFLHIYGPTKAFNLLTQVFQYIYALVTREQVHSALFTYYYFYYYFYFTEYILENVYLYFPIARIFFSNQIFSSFEGVYFSFFQIILGIFIPAFLIFIFSQYQIIRSFFSHKVYFVAGSTIFFYLFTLPLIYYVTGFSNLFIFFIFFIFFSIFFVFYIFEMRPSIYFDKFEFTGYSAYFLPPSSIETSIYLPKYYYKFHLWPKVSYAVNSKRKPFTRFPFTQNVNPMLLHIKRVVRLRLLELSLTSTANFHIPAPTMAMSGLVFPKIPGNHAYSIQNHRKFINHYPQKLFSPFAESTDHDYYDNFERDHFPIFVRDFMNHADGYSQISFIEFISKNKSFRSFDNQFKSINDEEYDFYNSIPSKKALEYLYPFLFLKLWLNSINPEYKDTNWSDEDFKVQKLIFESVVYSNFLEPRIIPKIFIKSNSYFFTALRRLLDRLTFYSYKKFATPRDTEELLFSLRSANRILIESKKISPLYYKNLFIFLSRSIYHLNKAFFSIENFTVRQIFTYTLILRQIEEIYFNVNQRLQYQDKLSLDYRLGNFFLIKIQAKLDGFSQIKLSRK